MHGLEDHDLMMTVKQGDLDKLGLLFERHHQKLYNLFICQIQKPDLAEDLVQEVFMRIIRYRHTYRGEGKFTTWMYSIARSAKADHFRKARLETHPLDQSNNVAIDALDPEEETIQKDLSQLLHKALASLSEEKRDTLLMSRFQYMKYEDIAKVMHCSVGTIKSRVYWALKDLSKIYKQLCGEDHEV